MRTGTGFVLPALAESDPDFALRLAQDLVENLDQYKRHEFIDAKGKPDGPADFLGSLSMPLMGTRAILTGRSLLDDLCMKTRHLIHAVIPLAHDLVVVARM